MLCMLCESKRVFTKAESQVVILVVVENRLTFMNETAPDTANFYVFRFVPLMANAFHSTCYE